MTTTTGVTAGELGSQDGERAANGRTIADERGFEALTGGSSRVAGAYFYLMLDCLIDCAKAVAFDFVRRPQLYTRIGDPDVTKLLARLRARYGTDERVPSGEQRDMIFMPLFGQHSGDPGNGQGDFPRLRDDLIAACAAFAERVFDTGEEMLRERVRTSHRPLREYLTGLEGVSLEWNTDQALTGATRELAYPILRDRGLASVFGLPTAPQENWPFTEDANADKLVEEISKNLFDGPPLTREVISNRQRAALRGTEALTIVLRFNEEDPGRDLDRLITTCYTWGSALNSLNTVGPVG
jgi:hypothetical protein